MMQPDQLAPPDDTGSDTFARFKYQAHVTFPYCFELTRDQAIESVFAEHIEDIALDLGGSWRFLQVKTRDAGLGPWTFSEVVRNGAIRSLWRAFEAVGPSLDATYELQLEGALKKGDALVDLASSEARDAVFRTNLASALGVDVTDVDLFANRLRVHDLPLRRSIIADNLRLMGQAAPHLTVGEIDRTYKAVLLAIESAMTADRLDGIWPASLFTAPDNRFRLRIASKRIGRDQARQIFAPILRPISSEADASRLSSEASQPLSTMDELDVVIDAVEEEVVALLTRRQYADAERILLRQPDAMCGRASFSAYLALARLGGRSFNALHPNEREKIEALVRSARAAAPSWELPLLLLAILEIDYYALHGLVSAEPVPTSAVRTARLRLGAPSRSLLTGMRMSRRALQELQLDSLSGSTT